MSDAADSVAEAISKVVVSFVEFLILLSPSASSWGGFQCNTGGRPAFSLCGECSENRLYGLLHG